jgi:hypothetical protein
VTVVVERLAQHDSCAAFRPGSATEEGTPVNLILEAMIPDTLRQIVLAPDVEPKARAAVEREQEIVEVGILISLRLEQSLAQHERLGDVIVHKVRGLRARLAVVPEHALADAVDGSGDDLIDVEFGESLTGS